MTPLGVDRDERTVAVENASFRWAYQFLSFGVLAIVAYRSFVWRESAWDLLGLVVLGGVVPAVYQARQQILTRRWTVMTLGTMIAAALLAAGIVWFRNLS